MLNKLAIINTATSFLVILFLSTKIPEIKELQGFNIEAEVFGMKIQLGYLVASIIIAATTRIIKLHDKISDILRLRASYDWNYIIKPLAEECGTNIKKRKALNERPHIMGNIFYRYTSRAVQPPIVEQDIIDLMMDQLSWSWALLETAFILLVSTLTLTLYGEDAYLPAIVTAVLFTFSLITLRSCKKYTKKEIDSIIADQSRKADIKGFINAL